MRNDVTVPSRSSGPLAGLRVLVVDDEADLARGIALLLEGAGAETITAGTAERALASIRDGWAQLVVSDVRLPGMSGVELLDAAMRLRPGLPVVLVTGFGTIELAVDAMQRGASQFLTKPFDNDDMLAIVSRLALTARSGSDRSAVSIGGARVDDGHGAVDEDRTGLVAADPRSRDALDLMTQVAATRVPVLITGESGAGKEVAARTIHARSAVAGRPFLAVNCAALPDTLLESELFGYKRGAFTGAVRDHRGIFAQAGGGSVFLDELPSMSLAFQGKLLRVLQERTVRPLGGTSDEAVDFRLLCSANRNLRAMVDAGEFREDLYYRISVFTIDIPPLRERPGDVPPLARRFVRAAAGAFLGSDAPVPELSPAALDTLLAHDWPGNVRELENVMQRAVILSRGARILPGHLLLQRAAEAGADTELRYEDAKQHAIEAFQRRFLERALVRAHGNVSRAAEFCGLTRVAMQKLMRKLALERDRYTGD